MGTGASTSALGEVIKLASEKELQSVLGKLSPDAQEKLKGALVCAVASDNSLADEDPLLEGWVDLEESKLLASLQAEIVELEVKCWSEEPEAERPVELLAQKRREARSLREKGVIPSIGLSVFRQIDENGNGTVERAELVKLLGKVPQTGWSINGSWRRLDDNKDGQISSDEWMQKIGRLPRLRDALGSVMDMDTGRVKTYRSVSEQKALKAGMAVFSQVDTNGNGTVERSEFVKLLEKLPQTGWSINGSWRRLDQNKDGVICLEEWMQLVGKLPRLRDAVMSIMDPDTGLVKL